MKIVSQKKDKKKLWGVKRRETVHPLLSLEAAYIQKERSIVKRFSQSFKDQVV
jgi:hypothetical protein